MGDILGADVTIIDSPAEVARVLFDLLKEKNLLNRKKFLGRFDCFVTDKTSSFPIIAERFLGNPVSNLYFTDISQN